MQPTDESLMLLCAAGDRTAFAELATRYRPRLVAMAQRSLRCADDAQDAAQEVLVAAFENRARYRSHGRFGSWLFALAANHLRELARARRRRRLATGFTDGQAVVAAPQESVLDAQVLWDALGGLSPNERASLLLHDLYGFRHDDIARLFGVAPGTARSWAARARQAARRRLHASDTGRKGRTR